MTPREIIGVVMRSLFGSNPNTEVERAHTQKLTSDVEEAVSQYKESTQQELQSARTLTEVIAHISKRL